MLADVCELLQTACGTTREHSQTEEGTVLSHLRSYTVTILLVHIHTYIYIYTHTQASKYLERTGIFTYARLKAA